MVRSRSVGKRVHILWSLEASENLNTQDEGDRLTTATGNLFEDMMTTYHPPGVDEEVAGHAIPIRR